MKKILLGCAMVGLLAAPAVQAQEADVFRPNSAWAADYGEDYCRLIRSFSDGSNEITLVMQRVQPGADTQVLLIGNAIKTFRGATQLGWHFLPNDADRQSPYTRSETGDGQQYLRIDGVTLTPAAGFGPITSVIARRDYSQNSPELAAPGDGAAPDAPFGPPPYDRAAETAAGRTMTGLAVNAGLTKPVRVETGRLDAPIAALQACTDDLVKTWGLDADKHKAMTMPAIMTPNPDGVLPQGTIPFTEFAKFAGGGNQVRLMLDASGKATACKIFSPTLSESLNQRICTLAMERAVFIPAKDAEGQPMASFWMGSPLFLGPPLPGFGQR